MMVDGGFMTGHGHSWRETDQINWQVNQFYRFYSIAAAEAKIKCICSTVGRLHKKSTFPSSQSISIDIGNFRLEYNFLELKIELIIKITFLVS